MGFLIFIAVALLLLFAISGVYTFAAACVRRKEIPWLDSAALKGTNFEKYEKLIHNSYDWLVSHNVKDINTHSNDGILLHGLWIEAQNAKGTIILAHGYKSTMLIDFGKVLDVYHSWGFNLLLPYQRAHGKSQGKYITFGVKESEDMLCWIDYHNKQFGEQQIILSGLSMGASTMMYLADKQLPSNIKGMIVDCGFSSPAMIISEVYKKVTHFPVLLSIYFADLAARVFAKFSLFGKDSRKTLAHNKLPIIMVHGKADDFVPCQMTVEAYEACTGDKQLFLVDNAVHGVSFLFAEKEYKEMVFSFLKKNIEGF